MSIIVTSIALLKWIPIALLLVGHVLITLTSSMELHSFFYVVINVANPLFWGIYLLEIALRPMFTFQSFLQVVCIPYTHIAYGLALPSVDLNTSDVEHMLPFEGEWAIVNGGINKKSSHSWFIATQRYAYDFLVVDEHGRSYNGCKTNLNDYYCYSKNVLASADGTVVDVGNACYDSKIFRLGLLDANVKDIRGNYVTIMHNKFEYSTIAHLSKDSILVKIGQKVKQGEVIAKCGNSGNSSEPHIHFQVQTAKSFFSSAGKPIKFNHIITRPFQNYSSIYKKKSYLNEIVDGYLSRGLLVQNCKKGYSVTSTK